MPESYRVTRSLLSHLARESAAVTDATRVTFSYQNLTITAPFATFCGEITETSPRHCWRSVGNMRPGMVNLNGEGGEFRGLAQEAGGHTMATTRPATVEVETTMRFVAPDFTTINVRASMRYDQDDPYAVHVVFHPGNPDADTVSWSFGRELLAAGLVEPAGIGDVRVWPWTTPRGESLALALSSPDGNALFEISRSLIARFLRRSYTLVPKGKEPSSMDMDSTVSKLLAER